MTSLAQANLRASTSCLMFTGNFSFYIFHFFLQFVASREEVRATSSIV